MNIFMEKSWNMKNWPKVMEFCDSFMEFYQFCPQFVLNLYFMVITKKLSSDLESLHCKFKIGERDGHGKSRNSHGKVTVSMMAKECIVAQALTLRCFLSFLPNYIIFLQS